MGHILNTRLAQLLIMLEDLLRQVKVIQLKNKWTHLCKKKLISKCLRMQQDGAKAHLYKFQEIFAQKQRPVQLSYAMVQLKFLQMFKSVLSIIDDSIYVI